MRITKFKIEPINPNTGEKFSEDETFEVTRETRMITKSRYMQETDENGNLISDRHPYPMTPPENETIESITATGMQRKQPSTVIILETDKGLTQEGLDLDKSNTSRARPVRIDELMRSDVRKIDKNSLF